LWFASLLFFNEKTTFLTFPWLARIRPDRILVVSLAFYVTVFGQKNGLRRLRLIKEEVLMLVFFGLLLVSCLLAQPSPLNYHLSTAFNFIGLPMFTFWLCRRLPFKRSHVERLLMALMIIGGYLGLCGICEHYGWQLFIFPHYIFDP